MATRKLLLLALTLVLSAAVLAEEITISSPQNGATIDPGTDSLLFSTNNGDIIHTCKVMVDGAPFKTMQFNDVIRGRGLNTRLAVDDGAHSVQVTCDTDNAVLSSDTRNFTARSSVSSDVTVTASGNFRGSMLHSFSISNDAKQHPIIIDKVAPGDYLDITLLIPPSKISKELYLKQSSSKNGTKYLLLEDPKTNEEYQLLLGENVTINITQAHLLLQFDDITLNKATVIAYPFLGKGAPPKEEPQTPQEPQASPANQTAQTQPQEQPPAQQGQAEQNQTAPPPAPTQPEAPSQGWLKRFLSWITSIFG